MIKAKAPANRHQLKMTYKICFNRKKQYFQKLPDPPVHAVVEVQGRGKSNLAPTSLQGASSALGTPTPDFPQG